MTIDEMLSADGYEDPCKRCAYMENYGACKRTIRDCKRFSEYYCKKWDLTVKILKRNLARREKRIQEAKHEQEHE